VALAISIPAFSLGIGSGKPGALPAIRYLLRGAILTVILVYRWAQPGRGSSSSTRLILAGVAAGAFAQSLAAFLFYRTREQTQRALVG